MRKWITLGAAALTFCLTCNPTQTKAEDFRQWNCTKRIIVWSQSCPILPGIQNTWDCLLPDFNFGCTTTPDDNSGSTNTPGNDSGSTNTPDDNSGNTNTPDDNSGNINTPDTQDSFALQVVNLVNIERQKEGLSPLTIDTKIEAAALVRAKEIQTSFSHTRPNGTSFSTALTEAGVSYRGSGENIAWGQKTPQEVVNAWMNSAGHRANILNKNYTKIGVGHIKNASGVSYWAQLFTY